MLKNRIITILVALFLIGCSSNNLEKTSLECSKKPETGMCKAMFTKYYFNQDSKKCEEFIWGGCGGNIPFNNLNTCKKTCEK